MRWFERKESEFCEVVVLCGWYYVCLCFVVGFGVGVDDDFDVGFVFCVDVGFDVDFVVGVDVFLGVGFVVGFGVVFDFVFDIVCVLCFGGLVSSVV